MYARINMFLLVATSLMATSAWADLRDDVAAKEASIAKLRAELEPLVKPILVNGNDLRVFASMTPLVDAFSRLNARPSERRLIRVRSNGANGYFWKDGEKWCNSYVELEHPDSLRSDAVLSNFVANVRDDGGITLATRATVSGNMQLKFQFKGLRVTETIGICPLCTHINVCPPGGGAGSSIGVDFNKTVDLQLQMLLVRSSDGRSVNYRALFVSPTNVSITAQIGLGAIGTLGHPISFDLPKEPIANGSFPLLISNEGKFSLPGGAGERSYSFVLAPTEFVADKKGITSSWKSTVEFKAAAAK